MKDTVKASCPPYGAFACDSCDFEGWVMYEFSDEYKEKWKDVPHNAIKFSQGIQITKQSFIDDLTRSMHDL